MALSPCKHPPLPNKPGTNYIEQTGGLPHFIDCIARAIFHTGRSHGDVSTAVKFAIGKTEDWAAGKGGVKPDTRAQAAAAVAQLKAQGAASKAKTAAKNLSDCGCGNLDLSQRLDEVIDLAYEERLHPRGKGGKWVHVGAQVRVQLPNWDKPGGLVHTITAVHDDGTATIKKPDAPSLGGGKTQRVPIHQLRPVDTPASSTGSLSSAERRSILQEEYRNALANIKPNVPGKRGPGKPGYSGQQIAAAKGIAKKRALARIDELDAKRRAPSSLPKRINSRAMTLTSDLERRVIDLTERLTA